MMIMNSDLNDNTTTYKEKMHKSVEYVESLEEERRKIQVFQRELPLCLELVSQAIEICRKELHLPERSDCSEQTSNEGPVLGQFIPIKTSFSHQDVQQNQQPKKAKNNVTVMISSSKDNNSKSSADKSCKKSDWLRSVQLWNTCTPDPPTKQESPRKVAVVEVKKNGNGGAFHPFKKEKTSVVGVAQPTADSSTAEAGGSNGGGGGDKCDEKEEAAQRKNRRCWSTELHRRFLNALQQLGGAHVATPKQIRELMKVDGLTNDEVKSHLQKYRLHTRRPSTSTIHSNTPQAPQFIVVGGIWVASSDYAATVSTVTTNKAVGEVTTENGVVFSPKAALPSALKKEATSFKHSEKSNGFKWGDSGNCSDGRGRSNSLATSSSTHTTTASPAF